MKLWKRLHVVALGVIASTFLVPTGVLADAEIGDTIVILGRNLKPQERSQMLAEMGVTGSQAKKIMEVTNQEEHQYLGKYLSATTIGTRALSSAKIVMVGKNKGVSIKITDRITRITESMYANAVITAGVKDVDIYITAPRPVSGTAALTGIIKAFEHATGKKISEEKKQVANQELVQTQKISDQINDSNKAAQFMSKLKEEVAKKEPNTVEGYKDIVTNISNDLNISLTEATINQLIQFAQSFSNLDINLDQLTDQISKLGGDLKNVLNLEKAKGWLDTILDWLGDIFRAIGDFFKSLTPAESS